MTPAAARSAILVAIFVAVPGCTSLLGPNVPTDNEAVFDELWTQFDRHYALFGEKRVDWSALRVRYRPAAIGATTSQGLIDSLMLMLRELHDVHVALFTSGRTYGSVEQHPRVYYSEATVMAHYVTGARPSSAGHIRYGFIAPDIGYVRIASFSPGAMGKDIDDVLAVLRDRAAIIVDVRSNGGGSNDAARRVAQQFAGARHTYAFVRWRNGPAHDDLTDFQPRHVGPSQGNPYTGAVFVLTNRRMYSAAEDFVLAMRALPNVRVIGDTTGGAGGNPLPRELPNGWGVQIPQWVQYTADRRSYEDIGIGPDIFVPATLADSAARVDRALERAIAEATAAAAVTSQR